MLFRSGVGLGHEFLRHIERTRLLLHLVDVTAADPIADYDTIQKELAAYGRGLPERPQILALNKIDAVSPEILASVQSEFALLVPTPPIVISAATRAGLDSLLQAVWSVLDSPKTQED